MTHVMIEDSSPEGKWLLELIKGHKCVTVLGKGKTSFQEAAKACKAVSVEAFTTEVKRQINEHLDNNA